MPDEVIDIELKLNDEKKSREERKANGRFAAVIVAVVIILLAIYHAWIRKTAVLAGILVPALIMILYGGWVVFLAKRDKKRRLLMTRQMEENARLELAKTISAATAAKRNHNDKRKNSLAKPLMMPSVMNGDGTITLSNNNNDVDNNKQQHQQQQHQNKHKKRRHKRIRANCTLAGPSKRPSFRQRLFRNAQTDAFMKGKGRLNKNLQLPPYLCRTNSAP